MKKMLATRGEEGVWRLDGGEARAAPGFAARPLLLVPAEQTLILAVALPLPSHARRLAALPFAIEERLAGRPDQDHLALASRPIDGLYPVVVVDRDVMAGWIAAAERGGIGAVAIMPDALALPVPDAGRWTVRRAADGRILVRTPDGAGFAARAALFDRLWSAAGKPSCDEAPDIADGGVPIVVDLRQGDFARPREGLSAIGRRVAIVAVAGLAAHAAIAAADTLALRSVAAQRGAELTALLRTAAPGRPEVDHLGDDPREAAAVAAELLPAGDSGPPGRLLPLLGRASTALAPFGGAVTIRAIGFDDDARRLRIDLDVADPAARKGILDALRAAGLSGRFDGPTLWVGETA